MTLGEYLTIDAAQRTTAVISGTTQLDATGFTIIEVTSAASSPVLNGFRGGLYHGQVVIVINTSGTTLTISTGSGAGRVVAPTTSALVGGGGAGAMFIYDSTSQVWAMVGR